MRTLYAAVATTTGSRLLRNTLGLAALLCAASVPGFSATAFLTYAGSWGTLSSPDGISVVCSATCNNTNETLSAFEVPIATLQISGAATTADNGTWNLTGANEILTYSGVGNTTATITVVGTIGSCSSGTCTGGGTNLGSITGVQTLETITYNVPSGGIPFSATLTGTSFNTTGATKTGFNLNLGAATNVQDLAALLTDLGEASTVSSVTAGSSANSTGNTGNGTGTHTFNQTGSVPTLGITLTSAPEPVSWVLFGTGLMGVALIARRRRVSQN